MNSSSCSIHGAKSIILVDTERVKAQTVPAAHQSAIPSQSLSGIPLSKGQQDPSRPIARPEKTVKNPSLKPLSLDLTRSKNEASDTTKILRFRESERMLHWAIAVPFMMCWLSALILFVIYNPEPTRPFRDVFSWIHRISGVSLILFPSLVMIRRRDEYKIHLYNIKCAWLWTLNDLKWLALMALAAVSKKIVLPEQGKFNAAEKVNFMSVMVACPLFIVTGLLIWLHQIAWAAWLVHAFLALLVSPTMLGHIYMATVNPDTKTGLRGMISGYVDRQWARHHYGAWYRQHFEKKISAGQVGSGSALPPDHHLNIRCPSCSETMSVPWSWALQKAFAVKPIFCLNCGAKVESITAISDQQELQRIKRQSEKKTAGVPPRT